MRNHTPMDIELDHETLESKPPDIGDVEPYINPIQYLEEVPSIYGLYDLMPPLGGMSIMLV